MDVVLERIGANTEATKQNGTHQRLMAGLRRARLRAPPDLAQRRARRRPRVLRLLPDGLPAGLQALGDEDLAPGLLGRRRALRAVGCHADRILAEDGRATGVEATVTHADGSTTALTVEAPTVVVACGSIESPALLLRSGIGGPAAGKNLRLHPAFVVMGVYDEPVEGWRGQVQSALSDHFFDIEDGCGFLIEATGMFPALLGASYPWESGEQHKQLMQTLRWQAPFITVARDHGSGEVVLDEHDRAGRALGLRRRGGRAAGACARTWSWRGCTRPPARSRSSPRTGASTAGARARTSTRTSRELERRPTAPLDVTCFTAHQMGSCRMGSDPETSVADGRGELHDVQGRLDRRRERLPDGARA